MKNFSTEMKVGIFALVVIFTLSYMTFKVGGLPALWEKGYRLHLVFDDINGLDEKSRIKIAGVDAGIVDKIELIGGRARVVLLVNPDIKVYRNAKASLRMAGLLGDRYLALSTGTSDHPLLKDGDKVADISPTADIDALASRLTEAADYIGELTGNLNSVFGEKERESIKESIQNIQVLTANLKGISGENREPIRNLIAKLERFTAVLDDKGPGVIDDISSAVTEMKEILSENRYAVKESIENIRTVTASAGNIASKIENGEGTLGKLVTDDELYESIDKIANEVGKSVDFAGRLRTFMDFRADYNDKDDVWKGYFDLTIQPSEDKYYIIGIVDDEVGSEETTTTVTNGVTTVETETESKIEFSAQIAKRYDAYVLRLGMTENTFGLGSDLFFYNDDIRIRFDVWDFSAREARAEYAHAKVGIDYSIFKHFYVSGGFDNLFNEDRRDAYIGGGFKFEDKDFKYLLGSAPSIPIK